jgi:tetratricopeptide (TPR) repeat protein
MNSESQNSAEMLEGQVREHMQRGQYRDAASVCDELNHNFPEYVSGWFTASQLGLNVGEPRVAVQAIDRALQLSPGNPELLLQKVSCVGATGDMTTAAQVAESLLAHRFAHPNQASTFARLLTRLGKFEDAREQFTIAIELDPDNGSHYYNIATVHRFLGDIDAAARSLDKAIGLNPLDAEAQFLRSGLRTQSADSNNVESLKAALDSSKNIGDVVQLSYALAKEYEDIEDYPNAFAFLEKAGNARRKAIQYDPNRDSDAMRIIRETYGPEQISGPGHISAEPIFVVGLPRTGTTLVDRILSSHPAVTSAGELQNFSVELVGQCQKTFKDAPGSPAELVPKTVELDFAALGEAYIASTRPQTGETAHFTDKLPFNFLYAGLIHRALPKSKIIVLERGAMDTIFAIYKTLFDSAYPYSYDLQELANYYVEYRQLLDHWYAVMPDALHVVRYEELVAAPKPVIEELLEFCNLSWDDACLRFEDNQQATTTASAVQVRKSLHTKSIGKWRHFEQQLQPVVEILTNAGISTADD